MSDEKSGKGLSLRRKKTTRPSISAPRPIASARRNATSDSTNNPLPTSDSVSSLASTLPKIGGDQTSDLVKRRYSTRFVNHPLPDGSIPPVPALPSLPAQYAGSAAPSIQSSQNDRDRSPNKNRGRGKVKVDPRALKDPNLMADKYVQNILAEATESDIRAYQEDLENIKAHTNADLQNNVYQNRTQFIKISKEADKLKSEMQTLRTLMTELTVALGQATSAGGSDASSPSPLSVADRKRDRRSSVANLEAMWSTHLQTLWKRVEGSQKYLPAVPGRHIIMESQRWVELNAATWKPRRRVALVLLNDHLLVASEKRRNDVIAGSGPSATVFVADRCWPLNDVTLADISTPSSTSIGHSHSKESKIISNAVNVRVGNESFTYAVPDSSDKASLIIAFRKAQEDLRKQVAAEFGEREKAMQELALLTGREPRLLRKAAAAANESTIADANGSRLSRSSSVLVDHEGRQQSVRWVESQIDGLDIDIALQRFEEAVGRVEKLRKTAHGIKGNAVAQEIIIAKVNERASRLGSSIARQLGQTSSGLERTKENVSWLLRLGFDDLARTAYLASRTDTIRVRIRQLPFTGALEPHVHALAYMTFTLLLHTFRTFTYSFPSSSSSSVVRWAKERVDEFNVALARQLSSVDRDSEVWNSCVNVVKEQASVLSEVGVDFRGLIARDIEVDESSPNDTVLPTIEVSS